MRKSSKAVSLLLAGLMATSCFGMAAVSASAATVDSEETGAYKNAQKRIAAGNQLVFFQYPDTIWGDNANVSYLSKTHMTNVFCNYYAIYGNVNEVKSRSWEVPATSMYKDSAAASLYFFDITESEQGLVEPGAEYGILFSTKANANNPDLLQPNAEGYQTCDMYFNSSCLGDTYYVDTPAATRENTANSQKIDYLGHSSNGVGLPLKKVSTLCRYIDGINPGNTPGSLEIANALKTYLPNPINVASFSWDRIQPLLPQFNTTAQAVYDMYMEKYGAKVEEGEVYTHQDGVDDLKPDGTLKDVYRYSEVTTVTEEDGIVQTKKEKFPLPELVAERLNLSVTPDPQPTEITAVEATMNGTVTAGSALPTVTGGNDQYTVAASWSPADATAAYSTTYTLTATFTANDGFAFTDTTTAAIGSKAADSVALNDGALVATFTYTTDNEPVPPEPELEVIAAGDPLEVFGTSWDQTDTSNTMTKNADGTYSKTYTVDKAYSVIQVKSVVDGTWVGDDTDNNVTFGMSAAGTFTVTYDPDPQYNNGAGITRVTGDNVVPVSFDYEYVALAGNGDSTWLNGASWDPGYVGNVMNEVAEDVWEYSFENVGIGFERQVKFAIDGTWVFNFGCDAGDPDYEFESGKVQPAKFNGDNITFDTEEVSDVTLQLDLRNFNFATKQGATFTITVTGKGGDDEIGIIGDVDGDGEVTITDATMIQRRGIELEEFDEDQELLGDVNGDGRISILDVTCIQKYLAEKTEGIGNAGKILYEDGTIEDAE